MEVLGKINYPFYTDDGELICCMEGEVVHYSDEDLAEMKKKPLPIGRK